MDINATSVIQQGITKLSTSIPAEKKVDEIKLAAAEKMLEAEKDLSTSQQDEAAEDAIVELSDLSKKLQSLLNENPDKLKALNKFIEGAANVDAPSNDISNYGKTTLLEDRIKDLLQENNIVKEDQSKSSDVLRNVKDAYIDKVANTLNLSETEREDFKTAAEASPDNTFEMIQRASTLYGESRTNFLSAMAKSEKNGEKLIDITGELSKNERANFLASVKQGGETLDKMLDLTKELSGENRNNFLAAAARLFKEPATVEKKQEEDLKIKEPIDVTKQKDLALKSTDTKDQRFDKFFSLTGELQGAELGNFLYAASKEQNDLNKMVDRIVEESNPENRRPLLAAISNPNFELDNMVPIMDKMASDERNVFLSNAARAGKQVQKLAETTESVESETRKEFLDTASQLNDEDLQNFLTLTSNPENTEQVINTTKQLEQSQQSEFLKQAVNLTQPDEQANFIKTVSNSVASNSSENNTELLATTKQLEDQERKEFLSLASQLTGDDLSNLVSATSKAKEKINEVQTETGAAIDKKQTEFFEQVAQKIKPELGENVAAGTQYVPPTSESQRANEQMESLDKITGEFIENKNISFLANEKQSEVSDMVSTASNLDQDNRSNFLSAAEHAGNEIDTLTQLTNQIKGQTQDRFLTISANAENLQSFLSVTQQVANYGGQTTNNFINTVGNLEQSKDKEAVSKFVSLMDKFSQNPPNPIDKTNIENLTFSTNQLSKEENTDKLDKFLENTEKLSGYGGPNVERYLSTVAKIEQAQHPQVTKDVIIPREVISEKQRKQAENPESAIITEQNAEVDRSNNEREQVTKPAQSPEEKNVEVQKQTQKTDELDRFMTEVSKRTGLDLSLYLFAYSSKM